MPGARDGHAPTRTPRPALCIARRALSPAKRRFRGQFLRGRGNGTRRAGPPNALVRRAGRRIGGVFGTSTALPVLSWEQAMNLISTTWRRFPVVVHAILTGLAIGIVGYSPRNPVFIAKPQVESQCSVVRARHRHLPLAYVAVSARRLVAADDGGGPAGTTSWTDAATSSLVAFSVGRRFWIGCAAVPPGHRTAPVDTADAGPWRS